MSLNNCKLIGLGIVIGIAGCSTMMPESMKQSMMEKNAKEMQALAPQQGYLTAHSREEKPLDLLGGPITVNVVQNKGGVFVSLPDERRLDSDVFGTPKYPRSFGGTPGINGVPLMARASEKGAYTQIKMKSPFGDAYQVMGEGQLKLRAVDATATDGATSKDSVQMEANWKDKAGNTYSVRCCQMLATHGVEFPTFGGVVTNHILHGFTRLGTGLMPTEYTYILWCRG